MELKSFKEINEGYYRDGNDGMGAEAIQGIIFETMSMVVQSHIFHLVTTSNADHEALGEFYTELDKVSDELAETFIGMDGDLESFGDYDASFVTSYFKEEYVELVEGYRAGISDVITYTNNPEMMSLNDKLIDVQELVDKLLYKLKQN